VKAVPFHRRRTPWRDRSPGELRARVGLNRRREVADSRVEQGPVVEGRFAGRSNMGACRRVGVSALIRRLLSGRSRSVSNGKRERASETAFRLRREE
jgi:hypothetical protein